MTDYLFTIYRLTVGREGLFQLAAGTGEKLKIVSLLIIWPVFSLLGLSRQKAKLWFRFRKQKFYFFVDQILDLLSFQEIFVKNVYYRKLSSPEPIILDLGAGSGDSTVYFKLLYPKSQIYAFEPQPQNWKKLRLNIRQFTNIKIFPRAVGSKNGWVKFYLHPTSILSSSLAQRLTNQRILKKRMVTLDWLVEKEKLSKIDLIKFDVEGAEVKIFKKSRSLNITKSFLGELHFDLARITQSDFEKPFPNFKLTFTKINENRSYVLGVKK